MKTEASHLDRVIWDSLCLLRLERQCFLKYSKRFHSFLATTSHTKIERILLFFIYPLDTLY